MKTAPFLLFCFVTVAYPQDFRAGVAKVEITPGKLMPMYGYANRKCGPANGTHDPLFAKALVLASGDTRMAIVTMDLGSMVSEKLRRDVADKLHIPVLLQSASHDHSAPAFLPYGSTAATGVGAEADGYKAEIEGKIYGAIQRAVEDLRPARLSIGRGSLQLGYNRLVLRDDGRSRAEFNNPERIPYGPVDPEFVLLRVDDAAGNPKAMLIHYAMHAVVLGPTNCKYSADYPGVLQAKVESELKGAQVMFVQGGAGDINPLFMGRKGNDADDFAVVQKMGETLAGAVLRAAKDMHPLDPITEPIRSKAEVLTFANRWENDKKLEVGITTVMLGRQIAIAAIPGEVMHKLQRTWKEQADVAYPLFYGYTFSSGGTWAGYIPDIRTAAYGGYGADVTTSIEVGAGEKILLRHLQNLYELKGMWRNEPGKP